MKKISVILLALSLFACAPIKLTEKEMKPYREDPVFSSAPLLDSL